MQWGERLRIPIATTQTHPAYSCRHYTAQQNLYARILARNYDMTVGRIYLVQLHPDLPSYKSFQVPLLPELAESMLLAQRKV